VIAAHTVHADPATPQLDSAHLQREDAQRMDEQQRRVDPGTQVQDTEPKPAPARPPDRSNTRTTGFVLLGVGATAAVLSTSFFAASALDETEEHPTRNTIAALIGVSAATAMVAGVALIITGRKSRPDPRTVQLVPVASPETVGLVAAGRF